MYYVNGLLSTSHLEDCGRLVGERLAEDFMRRFVHVDAVDAGPHDLVGVEMEASRAVRDLLEIIGMIGAPAITGTPDRGLRRLTERRRRHHQNLGAALHQGI